MSNQNMEFEVVDATRQGFIPLIGFYGGPGAGKTKSALLLARGMAGPKGKIVMIDTEERRGEIYADEIPGGYKVLRFQPPFSPLRYAKAIKTATDLGAAVVLIDSISHCWEGEGGVCDMAQENERQSKKPGLHNWAGPKTEHRHMLQFMLRSTVPIICCARAKQKTRIGRDQNGKQTIKKDEFVSPIQEADFLFELTASIEVLPADHSVYLAKCCTDDLRQCFPDKEPIGVKHGELIARWCAAAGGVAPTAPAQTAAKPQAQPSPKDTAKRKLWQHPKAVLIHKGNSVAGLADFEKFLIDANLMPPDATLATRTAEQLEAIYKEFSAQ